MEPCLLRPPFSFSSLTFHEKKGAALAFFFSYSLLLFPINVEKKDHRPAFPIPNIVGSWIFLFRNLEAIPSGRIESSAHSRPASAGKIVWIHFENSLRTSGKMERGRIDQNSEGCEGGKAGWEKFDDSSSVRPLVAAEEIKENCRMERTAN